MTLNERLTLTKFFVRTAKGETDPGADRVATLSLKAQFRMESEAQRAAFAAALREALFGVIARHTSPDRREDGKAGAGRRHRLVLACYPVSGREERPGGGRT